MNETNLNSIKNKCYIKSVRKKEKFRYYRYLKLFNFFKILKKNKCYIKSLRKKEKFRYYRYLKLFNFFKKGAGSKPLQ